MGSISSSGGESASTSFGLARKGFKAIQAGLRISLKEHNDYETQGGSFTADAA